MIAGETRPKDYVIKVQDDNEFRIGKDVGRVIFEHHTNNDALPWHWHSWVNPARSGRCDTLEDALCALRAEVMARLTNDRAN